MLGSYLKLQYNVQSYTCTMLFVQNIILFDVHALKKRKKPSKLYAIVDSYTFVCLKHSLYRIHLNASQLTKNIHC